MPKGKNGLESRDLQMIESREDANTLEKTEKSKKECPLKG
jgi:hypothetical protein